MRIRTFERSKNQTLLLSFLRMSTRYFAAVMKTAASWARWQDLRLFSFARKSQKLVYSNLAGVQQTSGDTDFLLFTH